MEENNTPVNVLSDNEVIMEEQYWEGECQDPGDDICSPKGLVLTGMLYDMTDNFKVNMSRRYELFLKTGSAEE